MDYIKKEGCERWILAPLQFFLQVLEGCHSLCAGKSVTLLHLFIISYLFNKIDFDHSKYNTQDAAYVCRRIISSQAAILTSAGGKEVEFK